MLPQASGQCSWRETETGWQKSKFAYCHLNLKERKRGEERICLQLHSLCLCPSLNPLSPHPSRWARRRQFTKEKETSVLHHGYLSVISGLWRQKSGNWIFLSGILETSSNSESSVTSNSVIKVGCVELVRDERKSEAEEVKCRCDSRQRQELCLVFLLLFSSSIPFFFTFLLPKYIII